MNEMNTWQRLGLNSQLTNKLAEEQIMAPTGVQEQAIPLMLEGKDLSVRSQTGSGKSLAFLLPLLQSIDLSSDNIQAIVLAPTQELAMQLVRVAELYAQVLPVRVQQLIGGAALKRQVEKLKLHPQLIIGTPGRIAELLKLRKLKLTTVKHVVIDEADQVFQLGSSKDVESVLFACSRERQTAFFSATYPEQMSKFEQRWMKQPDKVMISPSQRIPQTVENFYVVCEQRNKLDTARKLLRMIKPAQALLFLNDTEFIANWESKLKYEGFTAETLYGDADKQRRASTLGRFKEGKCQLLLATDVAARGIDIDSLPLVLQLDPAPDADHYVHRAGRTGRMGRSGTVITIVTPQELFIMNKFRKQLGIDLEEKMMFKGKLLSSSEINEWRRGNERVANYEQGRSLERRQGEQKSAIASKQTSPKREADEKKIKGQAKQQPAKPTAARSLTKAQLKEKKKKDNKNKGAPRWLKDKQNAQD